MISATPIPSVFDAQPLAQLQARLRNDDPQALQAAARQFEAVFLQMVLKSMRATTSQTGPFDSDQTRFYQELLDSQLAQALSARGGTGLAAVIERQLSRAAAGEAGRPQETGDRPRVHEFQNRVLPPLSASPLSAPVSFTNQVWHYAEAASRTTGIPAHFHVAHAALESGWGRSEPRFADGRPSHNLFGIKAGSRWQGPVVEATTTEYVDGGAERRVERFRAYASYAEAFNDYAQLLAQAPRYAEVLGSRDAASFAQGLQRAGYATDPAYAAKLERTIASLATLLAGTRVAGL